jgi:hypothetical protein
MKISNYLKITLFILCSSLFLQSCSEDLELEQEIEKISISKIDLSKFKTNKKLKPIINHLKNNSRQQKNSNKNFIIDTNNIIETKKGNITNFTFNIIKFENSQTFDSFIISEKNENYTYHIISYKIIDDDIIIENLKEIDNNLLFETNSFDESPFDDIEIDDCIIVSTINITSPRDFEISNSVITLDFSDCFNSGGSSPGSFGPPSTGGSIPSLGGAVGLSALDRKINALEARLDLNFTDAQEQWLRTSNNAQKIDDLSRTFNLYNATDEYIQNIQNFIIDCINFMISNGGNIFFDNDLTNSQEFESFDEFQNFLDGFNNSFNLSDSTFEIETQTQPEITKITKFKAKFNNTSLPIYFNVNIKSKLDNPNTLLNEYELKEVNSYLSGLHPFFNWIPVSSNLETVTDHISHIRLDGYFSYGAEIMGQTFYFNESDWTINLFINNQTGVAITWNSFKN